MVISSERPSEAEVVSASVVGDGLLSPSRAQRLSPRAVSAAWQGWVLLLLAGLGAIFGYYLLPQAGVAQAVVLSVVNAAAAVAAFVAAVRSVGLSRVVWVSLGVGLMFSTLANIPYYGYPLLTGRPVPFPCPVDALWLLTYPCFVVALWALAKQRRGDDYGGNLLDAVIIVGGGGALMWVFVLGPVVHSSGLAPLAHVVSVLYPLMDLVVFAMLVRLLVGSRHSGSIQLLVASFVALLVSDTVYALALAHGTYHFGGPSDVALVASLSVMTFLLVMARMAWLNGGLASARRAVEHKSDQLCHQALHDALTGLPNRALIMDRIERLQARNRRNGTAGAALFVDLDGFKDVNDTLGHAAGDRLLQAVAARLTASLREADTIGRMGGDEFVV